MISININTLKEGGLFEAGNTDDLTANLIDFNNNKEQWVKRAIIAKKVEAPA